MLVFVRIPFGSHEPLPTFLNLTNLVFHIISMLSTRSSEVPLFNLLNFSIKHNQLMIAHTRIFNSSCTLIY